MIPGKEERLALILLTAVIVAVLAAHIILLQIDRASFAQPYHNTSKEGELVYFSGNITGAYTTNTGGHLVIETEGPDIFFESGAEHLDIFKDKGNIKVTGLVSVYNGKNEIIVEDLKYIELKH